MVYALGLDFGTTNTAACARFDDGRVQRLTFTGFEEASEHCRSALFFLENDPPSAPPLGHAGDVALRESLSALGEGRFMQSLKSFLASRTIGATQVYSRQFSLEELLTFFLRYLRERVEDEFGGPPRAVTVGVPVRFAYAKDADDDELARGRLRTALEVSGFEGVSFALEPVAAAWAYAQRKDAAGRVVVADFGGGTSDFAVVELSQGSARVLATSGVAVAGDDLDAALIRRLVAPALGLGSTYVGFDKKRKEIPRTLFNKLERWHHLSFMNNAKTLRTLRQFERDADEPDRIAAFISIIEENLGFHLHNAVRLTKQALSVDAEAAFVFNPYPDADLKGHVTRGDFESWIAPQLESIAGALDAALGQAQVEPSTIDAVFMTGGTSFVPAVRGILLDRFGPDKLAGGDELVSIAGGLAAIADRGAD